MDSIYVLLRMSGIECKTQSVLSLSLFYITLVYVVGLII